MRIVPHCCTAALLAALLALPVFVGAEEGQNYAKDAANAENTPPMIPHRIKDTSDGTYCLSCHGTGKNGAPETPHPERLSCTGCHGLGVIKDVKLQKKGTKK